MFMVKTEKMTKLYNKQRGVIDLDLEVREGDFFGFIGPNGAGKSTTIRSLLGLISLTSGYAEVAGLDVSRHRVEILSKVGYLPSETVFYSGMKVADVLELSARLRKKDCRKEAAKLCERLELDVTRRVDELSFGNRKKVGIVAALQHKPEIYVLDEPTSGLDPLMQKEFYSILTERNEEGATVFLSSHILSEVERYCKTAAVIKEGRLLACDSVERLGHTGVKRVTLRGVSDFEASDRFKDVKREADVVTFLYDGGGKSLISELSALTFNDVTVMDPDLEEIFMHYYEREAN